MLKYFLIISVFFCSIVSCDIVKKPVVTTPEAKVEPKVEPPVLSIKKNNKIMVSKLRNTSWKIVNLDSIKVNNDLGSLNFGEITNNSIQYSGVSFVNNYSGSFQFTRMGVLNPHAIGSIMTQMASSDDKLNLYESMFHNLMYDVNSFEQSETTLILNTTKGTKIELVKK